MATVTYKNQPGIQKTNGNVPLAGTSHVYNVTKKLWPDQVENFISTLFKGRTLHVCCGKSLLGDVRLDADVNNNPDILCDASNMSACVADRSFDTVLSDPPYNGKFQWNHDLLKELSRVAKDRIIFQHWFSPVDKNGFYRKNHEFVLTGMYNWSPKSYFGRMQIISVFDRVKTEVLPLEDVGECHP